ncbi:exo-alpha-sialidase [Trypanosoma cruzi]|nr:exo-alpha-sialidase [Trypanosoma cruzi]
MANSSAHGVKGQSIFQSPEGEHKHKVCGQQWGSQHVRFGQCDGVAGLPTAKAEHSRSPKSTAAQPIPEGGDVVPPCLGVSQALAREGTKLFRTDLWQHGEATTEGMIAVLPFAEHFSSGHAAAATHSACSIPSVLIPLELSRLPLLRCLSASPTM